MGIRRTFRKYRMERKIPKLTILILSASCFLYGFGAYDILNLPQDARSLALHNAASAYDRPLLRNNPATLSLASEQTIYSYLILPAGIHSGEIQRINKIKSGILAWRFSYFSYGAILDSETDEKTTPFDILLEMGYKRTLKNVASVGISGGCLFSSIADFYSQLLYTNIGLRSQMMSKRMGLGISLENLGIIFNSYTDAEESIPAIFRSSIYFRPLYLPVIISADLIRNLDRNAYELSGGLEFNPGKRITIRFGCSSRRKEFLTGNFSDDILADVSGGAGFQFTKMELDVGFINYGAAGYVLGFSISRKVD